MNNTDNTWGLNLLNILGCRRLHTALEVRRKSKLLSANPINNYTTNTNSLNPYYVTGFCDGEACFTVNFNKNDLKFAALKKELKPEYLLAFGITALQIELPFTMPDYQIQQYSNCKILIAPALTDLNNASAKAVAEKKKLWSSLKNMFSIEK